MRFDKLTAYAAALAVGLAMLYGPSTAFAYKSKTHIILANKVLADANNGTLSIPGLGNAIDPKNQDVIDALKQFPAAFRAGVLGPDNYPDLIGGQVWVHANGS